MFSVRNLRVVSTTKVVVIVVVVNHSYTKYVIQCHMVFNVTMVTFWMMLHMNK